MTIGGSYTSPPVHRVLPAPLFQDPPERLTGGAAQYVEQFAATRRALRARPREWALVAVSQRSSNAAKLATNIRLGKYGFSTAEVWEATSRRLLDDDGYGVWVKYHGPDETAPPAPASESAFSMAEAALRPGEVTAPDGSTVLPNPWLQDPQQAHELAAAVLLQNDHTPAEVIEALDRRCAACGAAFRFHPEGPESRLAHRFIDTRTVAGSLDTTDQGPAGSDTDAPEQARDADTRTPPEPGGEPSSSRPDPAPAGDNYPCPACGEPNRSPHARGAHMRHHHPGQAKTTKAKATRRPRRAVATAPRTAEQVAHTAALAAEYADYTAGVAASYAADALPDTACCPHPPRMHDDADGCRSGRSSLDHACGCSASPDEAERSQNG